MSKPESSTSSDAQPEDEFTPAEEIIADHRGAFETIARNASDPEFREKYGARPLRYLQNQGGDQ